MHGAEKSVVAKIRTNVAMGGGGAQVQLLDKYSRGGGGDPLSFCHLDVDDIIISYQGGSR